jgi:hypothetical protein
VPRRAFFKSRLKRLRFFFFSLSVLLAEQASDLAGTLLRSCSFVKYICTRSSLRFVDMSNQGIGDVGAVQVAKALPTAGIKAIAFTNNGIGPIGW